MKEKARQYLETQILTAPREQLLLLLFDGAIRFAEQARELQGARDAEGAAGLLLRAQRIVIELMTALKPDQVGEVIYRNLMGLYVFAYFRLVKAGLRRDPALVDEALRILRHVRETWSMAIEKDRREKFPEAARLEKAQREHAPPPSPVNLEG